MKRNKCLTGYVVLFMIGSFSLGLTLLLTAVVLQQEQQEVEPPTDGGGAPAAARGGRGRGAGAGAAADPTGQSLRTFATVNVRRQLNNRSLPFVQDVVCGGCRSRVVQLPGGPGAPFGGAPAGSADEEGGAVPTSSYYRCGDVLRLDTGAAAKAAALAASERQWTGAQRQELATNCRSHCYDCPAARKRYWRYDRVLLDTDMTIPTLQLLSVPAKHRIPDHVLRAHVDGGGGGTNNNNNNLTDYLQSHMHRSIYYFDYNPSIVLIPPSMRKDMDPLLGVAYVASFRVSTMHSCFRPEIRKFMKRNKDEPTDYVGLALLDDRLEVIQDAVFDLRPSLLGQGVVQDVRLFVLHGSLYLSSHDWIAPIWIGISGSTTSTSSESPPPGYRPVRRVFGNLERHNLDVWMRAHVSCAGCAAKNGTGTSSCGKNFNYFAASSSDATTALVEVWPSPPHHVRTVDLHAHCQRDANPERFVDDAAGSTSAIAMSSRASSFATVEELHFSEWDDAAQKRLLTRGRGGACCVEIPVHDPASGQLRQAMVGIQHVKTPPQKSPSGPIIENHYLSRFYAFETAPPYRLISQSGYFCLGFSTDMDPLNEATRWRSLILGERFENCPRIHFVSGMTLKSQDPSTLVVAYGINDCVSAIAQVPVQAVQQLLYRGPAMLRRSPSALNTAQA